ncbi:hypothetical protein AAVH_09265 [Aphelenchoides avenae]|nr:hypothetical protein AAVH_09265 [Aphelenchus avenae]
MTASTSEESPPPVETYGGQYRSVAFGTWKVGQARRFAEKYRRINQRAQSVQHDCQYQYKQPSPSKEPILVRMTRSLDAKAARKALADAEDSKAPLASASTSGASSPLPEGIPRSHSHSDLPAKTAPADNVVAGGREHMVRMGDIDCYSSSEYVQFHNAYENVVIGKPLQRRDTFNRSMDALNERVMQCTAQYPGPQMPTHGDDYLEPLRTPVRPRPIVQTTTFPASTFGPYTSAMYNTGHPAWMSSMNGWNPAATPSTSYYDPMSCSTLQTPRHYHHRQYTESYPTEFSPSPSRQFIIDSSVSTMSNQPRGRAKSLDNASRFGTRPRTKRDCSESQAEDGMKSGSALQSARNFLRKIYTSSTLRFRPKNGKRSAPQTPKFQHAISPFFEVRLPEPEERPFLPYKIKYELKTDSDDQEEDIDDGDAGDTEMDLTTESGGASTVATGSTTAASSFAQSSPDEGMFSSEDKSISGSDHNNSRAPLGPALSSPASSSSAYGSLGPKSASTPNRRPKVSAEKFTNWNDLFSHLKKEITEIRERDADLLSNLTTLKTQIEDLKTLH